MDTLILEAQARQVQEKPKVIRGSGRIPAVYYGRNRKNQPIIINYQTFKKIFNSAGENTIINLSIDGKASPVLVYDVQYDPVSDKISHVDFIHVDMEKEITTSVKVVFVGVSLAVKDMGGILDVHKHELKIKCLPKDLIHSVEVDISSIADFHTTIHVKDVKVPSTIKILDNPDSTVVTAVHQKVEEETKPAEAAVAAPGAVPAEGALAPTAGAAPTTMAAPAGKKVN